MCFQKDVDCIIKLVMVIEKCRAMTDGYAYAPTASFSLSTISLLI